MMNSCIKHFTAETVQISNDCEGWPPLTVKKSWGDAVTLSYEKFGVRLDIHEIQALLDTLHCYVDNSDFTALADTSEKAYIGKIMRVEESKEVCKVLGKRRIDNDGISSDHWIVDLGWFIVTNNLLPLVEPEPQYSPYTIADVQKEWLGRRIGFAVDGHDRYYVINGFHCDGLFITDGTITIRAWDWLAANAVWEDTGKPVGKL